MRFKILGFSYLCILFTNKYKLNLNIPCMTIINYYHVLEENVIQNISMLN